MTTETNPEMNFDSLSDEEFAKEYNRIVAQPSHEEEEFPDPEEQPLVPPAEIQEEEEEQPEGEPAAVPNEAQPSEGTEDGEAHENEEEENQEEITQAELDSWEKRMTAPFKANGIELKVNTPDEAIKMMQMGANYTKKMQKLAPQLKIVEALKREGLLDSNKVNHLIDIYKKDPQAIAKLLEDSEIDPLSIDSEEAKTYVPREYTPSDEEFRLQQTLDDIVQDPDGLELLKAAQDWDTETKLNLQKAPDQLHVLVEQKKSGVYSLITQELERQKLFNPHLANMPFLDAYQAVGNYLLQQQQQVVQQPQPAAPVEVRAQVPQATKPAGNVKAASQVRNSQPKQAPTPDWETMSDEEFAKFYNNFVYKR